MDLSPLVYDWKEIIWFTGVTMIIHFSVTTTFALLYALVEKYSLFQDSKLHTPDQSKTFNPKLSVCIKLLLKNFSGDPVFLPITYLVLKQRMVFDGPGPSWLEIVTHIPIYMIVEDTMFYWLHRLLHTPFLYKHIHKIHHQYHQPIPLAYQYSHPVENLLTGGLPLFTGPFLLKSHVYTFWLWAIIRIIESMDGHSGYDFWFMPFRYFPFRPGPQVHNYHHSHNVGNYASFFTIWDKLCGTDVSYKSYVEANKKR